MKGSVRKRGNTWSYCFDLGVVDGKRKRKEKGGFNTKKECESALRTAIKEYENCGSAIEESNITVSDYFDFWYKEYVMLNCKYNTQDYYKRLIKNHIKPSIGSYKLKSLTPTILQELVNKKYLEGLCKHSLDNFFGVLSGALKYAVYPCRYIKENPAQYIRLPKDHKPKESVKTLSLGQFKTITERFPFGSNFYVTLQIAFHTGLRGGEVTALTWDNIDFNNKSLTVDHTLVNKGVEGFELDTPKTKTSSRTIAIGDTLIAILKKQKKWQVENKLKYGRYYTDSNWVCTKENGEHITTNSIKYLSRVVNYELGINFNFHMLRHTHATMLLEHGANIKDIQARLGHTNISTTMDTYSHVTEKMKKDTVDILEKIIK